MAILAERNDLTGIFSPQLPFFVALTWPKDERFDAMIAWVVAAEQMGYYYIDFAARDGVRFSNADTAIRFRGLIG